jgi:hypothetical protein
MGDFVIATGYINILRFFFNLKEKNTKNRVA